MVYILMENRVKSLAYKHKERAAAWWNQLQNIRMQQDKPPIKTWRRIRRLFQGKFLPPYYHQILFKQVEIAPKEIELLPHISKSSIGFPLAMD